MIVFERESWVSGDDVHFVCVLDLKANMDKLNHHQKIGVKLATFVIAMYIPIIIHTWGANYILNVIGCLCFKKALCCY